MSSFLVSFAAVAVLLVAGCDDKNYGEPLDDPSVAIHANGAVTNTSTLSTDTTNDSSLFALNGLSGNMNILAGIKQQRDQASRLVRAEPLRVDDACVDVSETGVVYNDCEWQGSTVNGSVSRVGSDVSIDLELVEIADPDSDSTQYTTINAQITISDVELSGTISIDLEIRLDNGTISADFDGFFDVVLEEGCAVGGELEIHAKVRSFGVSQSVWVLAEYGPECGDVVVR